MKRRTVQINLALLGLAALWVTLLAGNRGPFEAEHRPDPPGPAAASPGSASPASASDAAAIAGHHLFHLDRHNDFPEEATEDAGEALGPAPVLMGTIGIGGQDVALMVSRGSRSSGGLYRRLKVGEALDGYTLLRVEGNRGGDEGRGHRGEGEHRRPARRVRQAGEVRQAGSQAPNGPAHLHRGGVAEPPAGRPPAGPLHPFHPSRQSAGGHRQGRKAAGHHFHALRRHPALGRG